MPFFLLLFLDFLSLHFIDFICLPSNAFSVSFVSGDSSLQTPYLWRFVITDFVSCYGCALPLPAYYCLSTYYLQSNNDNDNKNNGKMRG